MIGYESFAVRIRIDGKRASMSEKRKRPKTASIDRKINLPCSHFRFLFQAVCAGLVDRGRWQWIDAPRRQGKKEGGAARAADALQDMTPEQAFLQPRSMLHQTWPGPSLESRSCSPSDCIGRRIRRGSCRRMKLCSWRLICERANALDIFVRTNVTG